MADDKQLDIIRQGVETWNARRSEAGKKFAEALIRVGLGNAVPRGPDCVGEAND